jgi:hypothetical protein
MFKVNRLIWIVSKSADKIYCPYSLDQLLILNQTHLNRVLREYTDYYNGARPHQGLNQRTPIPMSSTRTGNIHRRDILGGILHDYYRKSA